jgi:hypothetical protein
MKVLRRGPQSHVLYDRKQVLEVSKLSPVVQDVRSWGMEVESSPVRQAGQER